MSGDSAAVTPSVMGGLTELTGEGLADLAVQLNKLASDRRVIVLDRSIGTSVPAAGYELDPRSFEASTYKAALTLTGLDSNLVGDAAAVWFDDFRVEDGWQVAIYPGRVEFVLAPTRGITFYFVPVEAGTTTS